MSTATVLGEIYTKKEKLLHHIVHRLQQRYGGDYGELLSEAHYHFVTACLSWEPELGPIHKRIWYIVERRLKSARLAELEKHCRDVHLGETAWEQVEDCSRSFDPEQFCSDLSADAREVARLAISNGNGQTKTARSTIANYLFDLGWSAKRIVESFGEIREALG